jgi:hypothetical protein
MGQDVEGCVPKATWRTQLAAMVREMTLPLSFRLGWVAFKSW